MPLPHHLREKGSFLLKKKKEKKNTYVWPWKIDAPPPFPIRIAKLFLRIISLKKPGIPEG